MENTSEQKKVLDDQERAAYGKKREPMLKDRAVSDLSCSDRGIQLARDFYEDKIASGELIVKSELVEWLEEELRCSENASAHTMVISPDVPMVLQRVLDHINKKGSTTP